MLLKLSNKSFKFIPKEKEKNADQRQLLRLKTVNLMTAKSKLWQSQQAE